MKNLYPTLLTLITLIVTKGLLAQTPIVNVSKTFVTATSSLPIM
jgi:hypothetical protein